MSDVNDVLYKEVIGSIKSLFDLSVRVEERVKMMLEKQTQMDARIESLSKTQADAATKVSILETRNGEELKEEIVKVEESIHEIEKELRNIELRLHSVEGASDDSKQKWASFYSFIREVAFVIIVCYLLYRLELQGPELP